MLNENTFVEDAYESLKNTALFGPLNETTLKEMISQCTPFHWHKNETLDDELTQKYLFIILEGKVKVTHVDPHTGRSIALYLKVAGDLFDLLTFLDGEEHINFPIIMENMNVLRIPLEEAHKWMIDYPEFNALFLPYLGNKMRHLESFGTSLVFQDTNSRLAKLILDHTLPEKENGHHPVKLINNLSHESLAELIGSVRSVVSVQMHKLKEEDIIFHKRGHLAVDNLKALYDRANL